jgi:hypothetical protein
MAGWGCIRKTLPTLPAVQDEVVAIRAGLQRFASVHSDVTVLYLGIHASSWWPEDRGGSHTCNRETLCGIYARTTKKRDFQLHFRISNEQITTKRRRILFYAASRMKLCKRRLNPGFCTMSVQNTNTCALIKHSHRWLFQNLSYRNVKQPTTVGAASIQDSWGWMPRAYEFLGSDPAATGRMDLLRHIYSSKRDQFYETKWSWRSWQKWKYNYGNLYPQRLLLISPTSGARSRTQATEFVSCLCDSTSASRTTVSSYRPTEQASYGGGAVGSWYSHAWSQKYSIWSSKLRVWRELKTPSYPTKRYRYETVEETNSGKGL